MSAKPEAPARRPRRATVASATLDALAALDRAPIVLTASRTRAVLLLAACAGFIALGLAAVARGEEDVRAAAVPTALLFGFGMLVAGVQIARPAVMTISAGGVHVRSLLRSWGVAWDEVGAFFVYRVRVPGPGAAQAPDVAAFHWRDPPTAGWRRFRLFRASGCDGTFGTGWRMSAPALADLLNAARDRWLEAEPLAPLGEKTT